MFPRVNVSYRKNDLCLCFWIIYLLSYCSFWSRFFVCFAYDSKTFHQKKKVFMLFMIFSDIICSTELKNYAYSSSVAKVYAVKFYIISITAWYFGLSYFGILVDTIFLMLKRMRKYYRVFPLLWDFFDLWMCKRCPYSELFWSAFFPPFPYSDWLRRVYLTWFYQFWGLRKRCFDAKKIALFWF